jgi:alginate O-acetyltransferase complex protein AlgI
MLFTEPAFLYAFLPVLLALYALTPAAGRNLLLVVASVLFYARDGGIFTWVILGSIAVNTQAALWIERWRDTPRARRLLQAVITANLASLIAFKYSGFLIGNINALRPMTGLPPVADLQLILPIGISFFTFHSISYIVDVYRRDAVAQKGLVGSTLYLLFFPQLIAGPIIRYHDIAAQLAQRTVSAEMFALGVRRFVVGLAKKLLIAGVVAYPTDTIYGWPATEVTTAHAWLAAICYTLQIYFDFSGYSDMAIGLGAMFGFTFPENFRYPYSAASVQEFWKRWHMSLSSWFRDYLYIPLGGNRRSEARVYANLATVFLLCGLWHGAGWTFITWGALHGSLLILERAGLGEWMAQWPRPLRHGYTLLAVVVTWVFFRADSLTQAAAMLTAMAGAGPEAASPLTVGYFLSPERVLAISAGLCGSLPLVPGLMHRLTSSDGTTDLLPRWWQWGAVAVLLVLMLASATQVALGSFSPFIYFRF